MTPIEIDHLLICTEVGARGADALKAFGLTEGSRNTHPGQGTANRRFFFQNTMLELAWVHDAEEARSEITRRTMLWERCTIRSRDVSPFGIGFHPTSAATDAPFPVWKYQPAYLPSDISFEIGEPTLLNEPMWFYMSFGLRPETMPDDRRQPMVHRVGFKNLTSVRVSIPARTLSPTAQAVAQSGCVEIELDSEHLLTLAFDNKLQQRQHDFRPLLPLMFEW